MTGKKGTNTRIMEKTTQSPNPEEQDGTDEKCESSQNAGGAGRPQESGAAGSVHYTGEGNGEEDSCSDDTAHSDRGEADVSESVPAGESESTVAGTPEETIRNIAANSKRQASPVSVRKDPDVIRRGKVIVGITKLELPSPGDVEASPSKGLLAPSAVRANSAEDWVTVRHVVTDRKLYGTRVYAFTEGQTGKLPREIAEHFRKTGKVKF